jgi:hypothetical protein
MPDNRRDLLRRAVAASGVFSFTSAAEAQEKYLGRAGDGGFARHARALPAGDALAFHDPSDVAAFPEFRYALDAQGRQRRLGQGSLCIGAPRRRNGPSCWTANARPW